jgi:hypothetical protein
LSESLSSELRSSEFQVPSNTDALAVLQRVRQPKPLPRPGEICEMCSEPIAEDHSHVVNLDSRSLLCACRACYLLFTQDGAARGRYRAVPERVRSFEGFSLPMTLWESLQIPVSVAFFFYNSDQEEVAAFYPSPAGATESLLPLGAWNEIETTHPGFAELAPDVEAVLMKVKPEGSECYLVPIDACYELVGHLRMLWRGFDGGSEARAALDGFFEGVRERARPIKLGESGA